MERVEGGRRTRPILGQRDLIFLVGVVGLLAAAITIAVLRSGPGAIEPVYTFASGEPRAIVAHPADRANLYALRNGVLTTSTDGGESWSTVVERSGWEATSLAIDAVEPETMYAAGPGLLERSDDGGRTWRPISTDLRLADLRLLAASPWSAGVLFAHIAPASFFESQDGGSTWEQRDDVPASTVSLGATIQSCCHTVFAGTTAEGVFVGSSDGRFWQAVPDSPPRVNGVASDIDGRLFVATDNGIVTTRDRGKTWESLSLTRPIAVVAVSPKDAGTIYALDASGRLFRSEDGGKSW